MEEDASLGTCEGKRLKELVVKKKKKRETASVRTQGPLMETAKVGTSVPLKANSLAKFRKEPSKNQWKGGEFRRSERRRSGRKDKKKK